MSATSTNAAEFTVSEISGALKRTLEDAYGYVRVRGELGRVVIARSGHMYADLKDEKAVLAGVAWKGNVARFAFKPEEGLEVIAEGRISTFPGQSKYQLIIDRLAPAGVGALMALYEDRKKKLATEGLFDAERKRRLPYLPEVVGVVTSPTGAVIRDILHRLSDRCPRHVLLWPVLVQGEKAAQQIAAAITGFNNLPPDGPVPVPDVLIVARGGGSIEDLWAFNEEVVARAAAASRIPLISAVGHETDTTLIDYVADVRAPTPTGAAEIATPVRAELLGFLGTLGGRLVTGLTRGLEARAAGLKAAVRGLPRPEDLVALKAQACDRAADRLDGALLRSVQTLEVRLGRSAGRLRPETLTRDWRRRAERLGELQTRARAGLDRIAALSADRFARAARRLAARDPKPRLAADADRLSRLSARLAAAQTRALAQSETRLGGVVKLLEGLSHKGVLARGYAYVSDAAGAVITRAGRTAPGAAVTLTFQDASVRAVIGEPAEVTRAPSKKPKAAKPRSGPPQGDLF
ncbi:MAG: exodeoxyribonuclease VII large subunit [Maricaulaceae bacterium]